MKMIRISCILKGGRSMYTYTATDFAHFYRLAAEMLESNRYAEVIVSNVELYAASPRNPYNFKQKAMKRDGQWLVCLTKQPL